MAVAKAPSETTEPYSDVPPGPLPASEAVADSSVVGPLEHDDIAKLAYTYWQARGCPEGSPEEDWLRAERDLQLIKLADNVRAS